MGTLIEKEVPPKKAGLFIILLARYHQVTSVDALERGGPQPVGSG